jgi:predicted nucleic-acid-binding protein
VRAVVGDDKKQAQKAAKVLFEAELIAISLPCLCEFVWVLQRVYQYSRDDIMVAIQALVDTHNVVLNCPAVDAGLAIYAAGGDFADGVIAYESQWLGGETFVSFDKKAASLLREQNHEILLLS